MICAALAVFAPSQTLAQDNADRATVAAHVLYVELFGNAILMPSINFERSLASSPYRLRLGLSPFELLGESISLADSRVIVMVGRHFRNDNKKDGIEAALGLTASNEAELEPRVLVTGVLGYRLEPVGGGVVFRIGMTPFLGRGVLGLGGGLSLGYAF